MKIVAILTEDDAKTILKEERESRPVETQSQTNEAILKYFFRVPGWTYAEDIVILIHPNPDKINE